MMKKKTKNEIIGVLGFGSQGRAIAQNFRDSKYDVIIGLPLKSKSRTRAKKDKFEVFSTSEVVSKADILIFALPDHLHGRIFKKEIEPNLKKGQTLLFLHGFSVHFGYVVPPEFVDVIMIAPHAPGIAVREKFLKHESISAFTSVYFDFTGKAKSKSVRFAKAIGIAKPKLVETTFKDEAIGDLFGEQTVLCGGMSELILTGYNTLVKNGIPEENAYLEVAYQLDLIIDLIKKYGIEGMYERISVAARYGSLQNGKKIIDASVRKKMESVYKEIVSGRFPDKLNKLTKDDLDQLGKKVKKSSVPSFEKYARKYSKK